MNALARLHGRVDSSKTWVMAHTISTKISGTAPFLKVTTCVLIFYFLFSANTSMDACLSMIMANMGKVQKNMLVYDPFVGSGMIPL